MSFVIAPCSLAAASAFVAQYHRHHRPARGHKMSLALHEGDGWLHGVAVLGRPLSYRLDNGQTWEVTRLCTDGTRNACSALYAAAARAARAAGMTRLVTYTFEEEGGASLRAAGWVITNRRAPRKGWDCPSRRRRDHGVDGVARLRWEPKSFIGCTNSPR